MANIGYSIGEVDFGVEYTKMKVSYIELAASFNMWL